MLSDEAAASSHKSDTSDDAELSDDDVNDFDADEAIVATGRIPDHKTCERRASVHTRRPKGVL
jgi:pyruvate/2-oxoglutarate dehydrogenase complex dihydrolipoamide dehydrogenase (E3) component